MQTDSPYMTTKEVAERLRVSERTVSRRMKRSYNPLPLPVIKTIGASNLWLREEVIDWEVKEFARTKRLEAMND